MNLTVIFLTGEKHFVEIDKESTVKKLKKLLYKEIEVFGSLRLYKGQTVLQDDQKLSKYQLQDGNVVDAIFEPEENIRFEVSDGGSVTNQILLSSSVSVKTLKGILQKDARFGVTQKATDLSFNGEILEDEMPLHFYDITDGCRVIVLKPFVTVTIEDNHGDILYKRLQRYDTIYDVKVKLSSTAGSRSGQGQKGGKISVAKHPNVDDMRLYSATRVQLTTDEFKTTYSELQDELTVSKYKLNDGSRLYLMTYQWTHPTSADVTLMIREPGGGKGYAAKGKIIGVEPEDTFAGVKVRCKDQYDIPVNQLKILLDGSSPPADDKKIDSLFYNEQIIVKVLQETAPTSPYQMPA